MIVELKNIVFNRGERRIFDDLSMSVRAGSISAIMGTSGAGKTTLLKLMTGQIKPDSGDVYILGERINDKSEKQLMALRKQMGMLFQSGALFTDLSVFENVAFPIYENTKLRQALVRNVVMMKLEAVGLRGAAHLMPSELSGGMNRRVALARAIVLDPKILFYDEPFAGQDPISMGMLVHLIKSLNKLLGLSSLIVSHDVHETASVSDEIFLLADGKVIASGTPDELYKSNDPWVKQFIHTETDGPVAFHYPAPSYSSDLLGDLEYQSNVEDLS